MMVTIDCVIGNRWSAEEKIELIEVRSDDDAFERQKHMRKRARRDREG
jgi:hypothetical protein